MKPPIPPPDGSVTSLMSSQLEIPAAAARVIYQGTGGWAALTRFTFKQFFSLPICWLVMPLNSANSSVGITHFNAGQSFRDYISRLVYNRFDT